MRAVTAKQTEALEFIRSYWHEHGRGPSIREIGRGCGIRSTCSAYRRVEALIKKGKLTHDRYQERSIRPADALTAAEQLAALRAENERLRAALGLIGGAP